MRPRVKRESGIETVAGGPYAYAWIGRPGGNGDTGLLTKGVEGGYKADVKAAYSSVEQAHRIDNNAPIPPHYH